jgi:competence protein ComEC
VAPITNRLEKPFYRPVIPITLSLMAGIILGQGLPGFLFPSLFVLLAAAVRLAMRLHRNQSARWSPLLATMTAGYLAMVPWVSPAHGPNHVVDYLDTGYWRIQGSVVDVPIVRYGRSRLVIDVNSLSRDAVSQAVRGHIRLTVMGEVNLDPGDRVTFAGKIRPLRNFRNPGGFDYRRHMAFAGIHGSAWVQAEKLQLNGKRMPSSASRLIHQARTRLAQLIDAAGSPIAVDEKAVLKALVIGDRSGIGHRLRDRFNRAGVGHLLAISGLHVGIVAAVAFGCFRWIFSLLPPLLWRGWGRQWAAAATVVPVLAYGVLAGMSPSTQRAAFMVVVFLAALILGRTTDILNTLAAAALVILVLFPPALFSISFQLSFAAVLAIVYGLETLGSAVGPVGSSAKRAGRRLVGFVLVSALAIAGTAPAVLYYFNQTSVVGIAANLLLVPLVGFVAVPVGLVSAVAALLFEPAAALGFWLGIKILHLALAGVDFFSGLPFAAVKTVTPSLLEIFLYYLTGWALLNLRKTTLAPWVLATAMVLAVGDGIYWSYQRFWHRDLKVTAIDVGQGGSTLIELPGGGVVLYDGGGFSDNRLFDMGRRVVAPLLWRKKIDTVDILVLSHPNADHLNGLIYIARHFNVRELWSNGDVNTTEGYGALMAVCREEQIVVRTMDASAGKMAIGPVTFTVLHPLSGLHSQPADIDQDNRNNNSLVLRVTMGETAFLLTGDIETQAERQLVNRAGRDLASTVLFVPHHGSRTSSSAELITAVSPAVVVISAGAGNRFGFPHAEVTNRYRAAGSRILVTGVNGAILMCSDGKMVRVHPSIP